MFSFLRIRGKDSHEHTVARVAPDIAFYTTLFLWDISPHERVVLAFGRLVEELLAEIRLGLRGLGYAEQSAGVFVDAVHQSYLGVVDVVTAVVLKVPGEGVEQGSRPIADSGMNHQSCRFVDHHQVVVLKNDVERDVLGQDVVAVRRTVQHHLDDVAGLYLVTALHRSVVGKDEACVGGILNAVARYTAELVEEKLIDPQHLLVLIDRYAVMLVKPPGVGIIVIDNGELGMRSGSIQFHIVYIYIGWNAVGIMNVVNAHSSATTSSASKSTGVSTMMVSST